jgi:hypothetical protein
MNGQLRAHLPLNATPSLASALLVHQMHAVILRISETDELQQQEDEFAINPALSSALFTPHSSKSRGTSVRAPRLGIKQYRQNRRGGHKPERNQLRPS